MVQALQNVRGRKAIVYWVSDIAKMSDGAIFPLFDQLKAMGKQQELDLVLFTRGGDVESPWRIVSLIREYCEKFSVLLPYRAHSAGTLLCLGADEIVMTPLSELGPIDPSRSHPLLPKRDGAPEAEPISVQDMRHAMQFIRDATASTDGKAQPYTPEAMAQIFTALFEKIHPLAIGAIEQSYALSKLIGTRALETHMDAVKDAEAIKALVDQLCDGYKSHMYPINRKEAKAIGLNVVDATPTEEACLLDMLTFYITRNAGPTIPPAIGSTFNLNIAWMDSELVTMQAETAYKHVSATENQLISDQWKPY